MRNRCSRASGVRYASALPIIGVHAGARRPTFSRDLFRRPEQSQHVDHCLEMLCTRTCRFGTLLGGPREPDTGCAHTFWLRTEPCAGTRPTMIRATAAVPMHQEPPPDRLQRPGNVLGGRRVAPRKSTFWLGNQNSTMSGKMYGGTVQCKRRRPKNAFFPISTPRPPSTFPRIFMSSRPKVEPKVCSLAKAGRRKLIGLVRPLTRISGTSLSPALG